MPEVETIRLGLMPKLVGQIVSAVKASWAKSLQAPPARVKNFLLGQKVKDIRRQGKVLIIKLGNDYSLLFHLKMTGQLILVEKTGKRFGGGHPSKSMQEKLPDSSTRVMFEFKSGDKLFFNDQRKFGWVKLIPNAEVAEDTLLARLGPEPLSPQFKLTDFAARISKSNAPIKAIILDQSTLAGIGNIYADESLHLAKIHSARRGSSLKPVEIERLFNAIKAILKLSIKHGGTSFSDYVNILGVKGDYLQFARVFKRSGQPCPVCGTAIEKTRVAGRGTHICPFCQKPPKSR